MGMNMHKHTAIVSSKTYRHNSDHRQSTTPKNDAIPGPISEKGGRGDPIEKKGGKGRGDHGSP